MIRAAFLDRDGTLNVKKREYITRPEELELLPGAADGVRALRAAGYRAVLATNQSAVARGLVSPAGLAAIHARLRELLEAAGAPLDGLYVCPHYKEGSVAEFAVVCPCRKPLPGLLVEASRQMGLSLADSVFIGDAVRDMRAGRAAGTRTVLVLTGSGAEAVKLAPPRLVDHVAPDLPAAARWICERG
jgi:D-glycero-D-manno-heptose 1,7-bisphosphate phosphatase